MNYRVFKLLLIIVCLTVQTSLNAQNQLSNKVGITFSSLGDSDIFGGINSVDFNYKGTGFYTVGINYIRGLNKWLELETGLEYSRHSIRVTPDIYPGMEVFMRTEKVGLGLLNVPATLRANFLKYFFINGGLLLDLDVSDNIYIENQTGIGGIAGLGVNYDFDFGLSVFLNPYIKAHSWIYVGERQKILEKGFRLGVTYDIRRIIKK
ncbi:MAG: hypothetical protein LBQ01_05730 [Prevotellaceae bacterium]|nr:hypothetical protein [Prevotellaceae bacterium]